MPFHLSSERFWLLPSGGGSTPEATGGYFGIRIRAAVTPLSGEGSVSLPEDQWMNTVNGSANRALPSVRSSNIELAAGALSR